MPYNPPDAQLAFVAFLEKERKKQKMTYRTLAQRSQLRVATVHGAMRGRPAGAQTGACLSTICAMANTLGLYFCFVDSQGEVVMLHPGIPAAPKKNTP